MGLLFVRLAPISLVPISLFFWRIRGFLFSIYWAFFPSELACYNFFFPSDFSSIFFFGLKEQIIFFLFEGVLNFF